MRCEIGHGTPCRGEVSPCEECGRLMCDEDGSSRHPYTCSECFLKIDHNSCGDAECALLRERGII